MDNPLEKRKDGWLMWAFVTAFFVYQFVLRVLPSVMIDDLVAKFHIDASAYGQFSGIYYIGYTLMHIPVGLMLDRIGPRKVVPICALIVSFSLLPLLYGSTWAYPVIGRLIMGMGASAATLGCFKIIRLAFEEAKFNRFLGISVNLGFLGAMYGGTPVAKLIAIFGDETVLLSLIGVGVAIAIGCYLSIPSDANSESDHGSATMLDDLKQVFSNKRILIIALLGGLMVSPVEGFADVWGAKYLRTVYGLSADVASFLPSLIFLGFAFGSPLLSYIADRTRAFMNILIVCGITMAISFIAILMFDLNSSLLFVLFSLVGVSSAYQLVVLYLASISVPARMIGIATAVANMIIMIFGYVFHSLIGRSMDFFWGGEMDGITKVYDAQGFSYSISIIPISVTIAVIGLLIIKKKLGKDHKLGEVMAE